MITLFIALHPFLAGANDSVPLKNQQEHTRYLRLIYQLRCPTCPNQSIADSEAPIAQNLRQIVYQQILTNKSNQQIIDFMITRYGAFILYQPAFNKTTYMLWCLPGLILLIGLFVVLQLVRRHKLHASKDQGNVP